MTKPDLKVIEGGLSASAADQEKYLISAYVTNTRLMGVLAIYAHWKLSTGDLHQFFYIDCEEMGFESYKGLPGGDSAEIIQAEQALVGGLGAKKIPLSRRQLQGLLTYYRLFNEQHHLPLPQPYEEYRFLMEPETILDPLESSELMQLVCDEIVSDYQAVNYFLMRCFGQDYPAALYLCHGDFPLDLYDQYHRATFCKNVIDKEGTYEDGAISYLCESLIEVNNQYETVVSKVIVKDLKIVGFQHCSGFPISTPEAAMILAKPEYVTVYEVMLSEEDIDNNIGELTVNLNTIMSRHETGRLFMAFKKTNDHVNSRIFRLSNDVKGVYFLTDYGQLLIAAYTLSDIRNLENRIKVSMLAPYLITTAKYEFKEPVLFEFIQSNFEDFDDFLEFIRNE